MSPTEKQHYQIPRTIVVTGFLGIAASLYLNVATLAKPAVDYGKFQSEFESRGKTLQALKSEVDEHERADNEAARALEGRLSRIEANQDNQVKILNRIENKLDKI